MRRAAAVDANQPLIVDALRKMGFKVYLPKQPFDLLICRGDQVWLGEVKDPKRRGHADKFTKAQRKLIEDGWPVRVFYEIADVTNFAERVMDRGIVEIPIRGIVT